MTMRIVESQPQAEGQKETALRHYLITVDQGSDADMALARLNHGLLAGDFPGLVDYHQIAAPTVTTALVGFAEVFGVMAPLYLHLVAKLQHKKSA